MSQPPLAEIVQFPVPLRRMIAARLRAAITSGVLKPGERLVESRLAKQLNVSRPALREALRQIEAEGLIDTFPNVGSVVHQPTHAQLQQIYDLRGVVEGLCARYFAVHADDATIDRLEHAVDRTESALREADIPGIKQAKQEFYAVFSAGCGSELIQRHVEQLVAMTSHSWGSSLGIPGRPAESAGELRRLVQALRARDPEAAAAASHTLIRHASMVGLDAQAANRPQSQSRRERD